MEEDDYDVTMVFERKFIPVLKTVDLIKDDTFLLLTHRAVGLSPSCDKCISFDVLDLL